MFVCYVTHTDERDVQKAFKRMQTEIHTAKDIDLIVWLMKPCAMGKKRWKEQTVLSVYIV